MCTRFNTCQFIRNNNILCSVRLVHNFSVFHSNVFIFAFEFSNAERILLSNWVFLIIIDMSPTFIKDIWFSFILLFVLYFLCLLNRYILIQIFILKCVIERKKENFLYANHKCKIGALKKEEKAAYLSKQKL